MSPSGTMTPLRPGAMMSRGPQRKSKLTAGTPQAIASIITIGKPS